MTVDSLLTDGLGVRKTSRCLGTCAYFGIRSTDLIAPIKCAKTLRDGAKWRKTGEREGLSKNENVNGE